MSILAQLLNGTAQVSGYSSGAERDRSILTPTAAKTETGVDINMHTAMNISAWFAAHKILSEQFSLCPLKLKKREKGGGSVDFKEDPRYGLLLRKPNNVQNAMMFKQHGFTHRFWNGNTFLYKQRDPNTDQVLKLIPLNPERVQVKQKLTGEPYFKYTAPNGEIENLMQRDVLHWIDATLDGIVGISKISYAATCIGIAIKQNEHEEWLLENRAEPSGVLSVQGKMETPAYDLARKQIEERAKGGSNAGKTLILDNGATYEQISMSPADMQYMENKRMGIEDCSRFTGVPTSLLSENTHSTWNNLTEQNRHFLEYGLKAHLTSFEMVLNLGLLSEREQDRLYFEFDKSAFREMDEEKRSITVLNQRYAGVLDTDEARSEFGLSPKGGDVGQTLWRPSNMVPADVPYEATVQGNNSADQGQQPAKSGQKDAKKTEKKPVKASNEVLIEAFSGLFNQIFSRMHTKTTGQLERLAKKSSDEALVLSLKDYLKEQGENYTKELTPTVFALAKTFGDIPLSLEKNLEQGVVALVDHYSDEILKKTVFFKTGNQILLKEKIGEDAAEKILTIIEAHHE